MMEFARISKEHDAALAALIRTSLKAHRLDIPGTAYYDKGLDHLSDVYDHPNCAYFVLLEDGHLAAQGRHEDLLQTSRIYKEIYDSQMGGESHG